MASYGVMAGMIARSTQEKVGPLSGPEESRSWNVTTKPKLKTSGDSAAAIGPFGPKGNGSCDWGVRWQAGSDIENESWCRPDLLKSCAWAVPSLRYQPLLLVVYKNSLAHKHPRTIGHFVRI